MNAHPGPLAGLRVLDLTRMVAGPLATQVFADMGATVIKIERPETGDDTRAIGPFLQGRDGLPTRDSAYFLAYNRGKQSITVDISSPQGAAIVRDIAVTCDVVVENYKVGALKKYGLAYEDLALVAPALIYCSITGFGMDGPYAARPGYDSITQGMAGLMSTNGPPDSMPGGEPLRTAVPISDVVTGLYTVSAALAALHRRTVTGKGECIDVSLFDASVGLNGHLAIEYLMTGRVPTRNGNANPVSAPSELFLCSDGKVMIAIGNNSQFDALCRVLALPALRQQEKFSTNSLRAHNRPQLHALIEACTMDFTVAALIDLLANANVPIGAILSMDEVFEDPQVRHRQIAAQVPHRNAAAVPTLRSPIRMGGQALPVSGPPALGEHTDDVLREVLGFTDVTISALRRDGVV